MNLFGRAITAVTRRKSKTLILLVLFWVIAILILSGFSIVNATKDAGNIARAKLGATLTLSFDRQKARAKADATSTTASGSSDQGPGGRNFFITTIPVTETMANLVKAIPHVKTMNIVESSVAMASGFTAVAPADTSTSSTATTTTRANQYGNNGGGNMPSFTQPDLTIIGVSSIDAVTAFTTNPPTATILSKQALASNSTAKGAYIEKSLADQNGLKLGSVIKITAYQSTTVTSLTVVGIYEQTTTTSESGGGGFGRMGNSTFSDPANTIYVNFYDNVVQTLKTQATAAQAATTTTTTNRFAQMFVGTAGIDSVSYQVDDPKNVQTVLDAAKKISGIDWTTYTLSANDAAYKLMMNPIDSISKIASMLIIVVSIAGALILALILALWIKERIYETGVLLSMGEGKLKVVGQYVCEVLVIAVIAFTVAIPSGMLVSKSVANLLMTTVNTASSSQTTDMNGGRYGGRAGGGFRDPGAGSTANVTALTVNDLHVNVTGTVVGELYAMGILIILLATIIPASSVMRLNPKTILTKAN